MGKRAVIKMGKTSKIHQMSIQEATANTLFTIGSAKGCNSSRIRKLSGPAIKPILRLKLMALLV